MSNKRELHTLFIKHDTAFGTLSKKGLSEVILKIVFFQKTGTRVEQIKAELSAVITGNISDDQLNESLRILCRDEKLIFKRGKYSVHSKIIEQLEKSSNENVKLQERVLHKYLTGGETPYVELCRWFQDTLILFFERYSMEWFNHMAQNGKFSPKKIDGNISSAIDDTLLQYKGLLVEKDQSWLKGQFIRFYESEEHDENSMFWNYGMSLFSSRVITAKNYADKISIETYRNGTFLLDTNILMILDLEGHELGKSFASLDKILKQLNIKTKYLFITREEYDRAISGRKADTITVFESFDIEVLKTTRCPFVQTALKRGCRTPDDVERMFRTLIEIPSAISEETLITIEDFPEIGEAIEIGQKDDEIKKKVNDIYFRRFKRNKRENPKLHDAGLIGGVNYLRKTNPTWILTTDGTLKIFAIENVIREETEVALGLDTLIGMLAVNGGGVDVDSSDFAPLFKNLIKNSLIPEENTFDVRDLAFILSTNLRINDLDNSKVVEIANQVRRMRIAGDEDDDISLYLRREIEGQKLDIAKELGRSKATEGIHKSAKEKAERERDLAYNEIRERRKSELRDEYDRKLLANRVCALFIPILISICVFLTLKYGMKSDILTQYITGCGVELIFGVVAFIPINKRLIKKHREYVYQIDKRVEDEIIEMKRKAQDA